MPTKRNAMDRLFAQVTMGSHLVLSISSPCTALCAGVVLLACLAAIAGASMERLALAAVVPGESAVDLRQARDQNTETPLQRLLDRVQERYRGMQDLRGEFLIRKGARIGGEGQEAIGTFFARPSGLMRWEYLDPRGQLWVFRPDQIFFYLPEDHQVQVFDTAFFDPSQTPTLLLAGQGDFRGAFNVSGTEWGERLAPANIQLNLLPRDDQVSYTSLILEICPDTALIERLVVYDTIGNSTEYRFLNVKIDTGLSDKLFEFSVPKGAEVIHINR